tara:strand:+ start:1538 stop:1774 length:237 start_codon:yes stop_codon:yes gene_type:complete
MLSLLVGLAELYYNLLGMPIVGIILIGIVGFIIGLKMLSTLLKAFLVMVIIVIITLAAFYYMNPEGFNVILDQVTHTD